MLTMYISIAPRSSQLVLNYTILTAKYSTNKFYQYSHTDVKSEHLQRRTWIGTKDAESYVKFNPGYTNIQQEENTWIHGKTKVEDVTQKDDRLKWSYVVTHHDGRRNHLIQYWRPYLGHRTRG